MGKDEEELIDALTRVRQMSQDAQRSDIVNVSEKKIVSIDTAPPSNQNSLVNYIYRYLQLPNKEQKKRMLNWLNNTHAFSDKELKVLEEIPIFKTSDNQQLTLREPLISDLTAYLILTLALIITLIYIVWVINLDKVNIKTILNSFAIGLTIGGISGSVIKLSFKQKRLYKKIFSIAPRFVA